MGDQVTSDSTRESDDESRRYLFGLSSRLSFLVVITVGLIGPGLGVSVLEEANLALAADIVWIVGYGTTIFVVWYVWIRPLKIVGTDAQDWSGRNEAEEDEQDEMEESGRQTSNTDQPRPESSQTTDSASAEATEMSTSKTNDQSGADGTKQD
jgi:hypothetical protein